MGYYLVLGDPKSWGPSHYRGLYRDRPPYPGPEDVEILRLWDRYGEWIEGTGNMGVTSELTLSELKHLAEWYVEHTHVGYELVYFDKTCACPHEAAYYGIDVTGFGGYSILGEGLWGHVDKISRCRWALRSLLIDARRYRLRRLIGEGRWARADKSSPWRLRRSLIAANRHFLQRLNGNGLFDCPEDADAFLGVLRELNARFPGSIEDEDWRAVHVFKVL
jgi:hypothetical protein